MKKLLLGYDGSEPAKEAARVAARLAEKMGGNVTVLTAGHLATAVGTAVVPTVHESAFAPVAEEGAQVARALGAGAEARVLFGDPAQSLVDVAAREAYDLVIVGHRGLGGIKGMVLGSVAKKVASGASCPVLVVRGPAPETIDKVLVAVDGSRHAERALEAAAELATAYAARITLVHVVFPPLLSESRVVPAARKQRPTTEQRAGQAALARASETCARMGVVCESIQLGVDCESVEADGLPGETLCRLARGGAYDLVAVGRRGLTGITRFLLGSVSDEVLAKAGPLILLASEHQRGR